MGWQNGTFHRLFSWNADAAAGIDILPDRFDTDTNDIVGGVNLTLARDGQNAPLSNLPMAGFKHLDVAPATSGTDYARFDQVVAKSGDSTITGNLTTTGNATIGGTLTVAGATTLQGAATVTGLLTANGGAAVAGAATVSAALTVGGTVTAPFLHSTGAVTADTNVQGAFIHSLGAMQADGSLTVLGNGAFSGTLTAPSATIGGLMTAGSGQINGHLGVTGNADITGALGVTGGISTPQNVGCLGVVASGSISAGGAISCHGLTVTGAEALLGNLEVGGNFQADHDALIVGTLRCAANLTFDLAGNEAVQFGPPGSGPGGSGRMLFVA